MYGESMTRSMSEVAGERARALRLDAQRSLEDVATAARSLGLPWSTGRVGDFEAGRAAPSLPTLLVVAAALGDVIGRPISLADLFDGAGDVAINDSLRIPLPNLRALLSGRYAPFSPRLPIPATGVPTIEDAIYMLPEWGKDVDLNVRAQVSYAFREADERFCKNIGRDQPQMTAEDRAYYGSVAMAKLWGRTFVAERDRRAGPDANAQRRGQVSRQLKSELLALIEGKEHADGDD